MQKPHITPTAASSTVESVENCVPVLDGAATVTHLANVPGITQPSITRKPAVTSVAICAIFLYVCLALTGSQYYDKLRRDAIAPLPSKLDVLMAGSSVIAMPLLMYEFPKTDPRLILDRSKVIETPKAERLLSSLGASQPVIYNGSAIGQSIRETEQFVQRIIALNKRPRLLVLWVSPNTVLIDPIGPSTNTTPHIMETPVLEIWRDSSDARIAIQMIFARTTTWLYWKVNSKFHLGLEGKSIIYNVQDYYEKMYARQEFGNHKLAMVAHILKTCNDNSIQTLVVSAPLSISNRKMMSPELYSHYHRMMLEIVQNNQSEFVDFGESANFVESSDFQDQAHCNGNGCEKLLRALAPRLVQLVNSRGTASSAIAPSSTSK